MDGLTPVLTLGLAAQNTRPKNDQERIVLRVFNGVIEVNRLQAYAAMLTKFILPEYLKA